MARIFLGLALIAVLLLIANATLGFWMGDYNGAWKQDSDAQNKLGENPSSEAQRKAVEINKRFQAIQQRKNIHFMLGLVATLITVLVNCITVTYFIGTSRWCAEVVDTYSLDLQLTRRSTALKRKTFPWAVGSILAMLSVVVLGALSDPAVKLEAAAGYVSIHYMVALLSTAVVAWSFFVQVGNIGANYEVIGDILSEVHRVRDQRGLDKNDE